MPDSREVPSSLFLHGQLTVKLTFMGGFFILAASLPDTSKDSGQIHMSCRYQCLNNIFDYFSHAVHGFMDRAYQTEEAVCTLTKL